MNSLFDVFPTYILCGSIALTYSSPMCYKGELCKLPLAVLLSACPGMHAFVAVVVRKVIIVDHSLSLKPFHIYVIFFFFFLFLR